MNTTLNRISKIKSDGIFHVWDLTYDGMFPHPRVKGKNKHMRNKARRRAEKHLTKKEVELIR